MAYSTEVYLTQEHFDAYIELVYSIMCVRHPSLHSEILKFVPGVQIVSSYIINGTRQDLCVPAQGIIDSFKAEGLTNVNSLKKGFLNVNSMFLVSMWALLTDTKLFEKISKEPDVQFFRHIRNGCAHGNIFNFSKLKYAAKWRDKIISQSNKGKAVFPDMLKESDPFLLLLDINNKYFSKIIVPGVMEYGTSI